MATASVSNTSECCICFETFHAPKILPCGHTFCLCCIEKCIDDKIETFPCPFCQQDVQIPEGGAKMFTTNFIVQTFNYTTQDQLPTTKQPKCPNHNQREVDYYCNNCNVGLCSKCIFKQHKEHETLDIECEETRNNAIEKLESSQNIIQNRIKHLEKNRSTLLESFEQLKSLCEDSCAKVTETTEKIVSNLRKSCEQIIKDIRKNLEDNRSKVEDREMEITSEINLLESKMESIISPSTETTLNILQTLHPLIEIEKLSENRKDYNLCIQYLQWSGNDFSLDIDQLGLVISKPFYILGSSVISKPIYIPGSSVISNPIYIPGSSVISKPFHIPGSYQFLFNVSNIKKSSKIFYNSDKFRNNNLVWSCGVGKRGGKLYIHIQLLPDDNRKLNYCIIDYQLSLLNIDDDSKTMAITVLDKKLKDGGLWGWNNITWSKLTDTNNGFLTSNGQFLVQYDITQIREIEFSQ